MNRYTFASFEAVFEELKEKLLNNRINNISVINSKDLLFSFTANRGDKMLVSLNHQNPFICMVNSGESIPTITGKLNEILRKELKDCLIYNVEILNKDKVLKIYLQRTNDFFQRERKSLIFELIPQRSNLLILDENDCILFAGHYSSLDSVRPIVNGMKYEPLEKKDTFKVDAQIPILEQIKKEAESYLFVSKQTRLKEKYEILIKHIKSRIKSLNSKIKAIEKEIEEAKENLKYQEYGTALLSLSGDDLKDYLLDNKLSIREDISIGQNANLYFKKYKKAKRTIEMAGIEIQKSINEIDSLEVTLKQTEYMTDEELLEVAIEMMPHKFKVIPKGMKQPKHSFIKVDNSTIYFGKNAKQNNELTFKAGVPEDVFLHIKDFHGSHILIKTEGKLGDEALLTAAEIALILSNKNSGDIYYTNIKNVKKSSQLGEVNMLSYKIITLHSVRNETIEKLRHFSN